MLLLLAILQIFRVNMLRAFHVSQAYVNLYQFIYIYIYILIYRERWIGNILVLYLFNVSMFYNPIVTVIYSGPNK